MEYEDVKKLLDWKIAEHQKSISGDSVFPDQLIKDLLRATLEKLKEDKAIPIMVFYDLSDLIRLFGLNRYYTSILFGQIQTALRDDGKDGDEQELKTAAIRHFKESFSEKYRYSDLPEQLVLVKQEIRILDEMIDEYAKAAFTELESELEQKIASEIKSPESLSLKESISSNQESETKQKSKKANPKKPPLSARQTIILLLTLMYGKPEIPNGLKQQDVLDFLESLKQIDYSNAGKFKNPKDAKPESTRERNARLRDIKAVKTFLNTLSIGRGRWKDIDTVSNQLNSEIESIKEMKYEDLEEKRNNY